jgi:serine protease Do
MSEQEMLENVPRTEEGRVKIGGGSGFFIDPSGLVMTNKHVVMDADVEYTVITASDDKYPAKVLARDPINDVAIVKIDSEGQTFPIIEMGDSNKIQLGQTVIAIGTALGDFQDTVSTGVVSGLSRFITAMTDMEGHSARLHGLIQTDAAINPGNSGGPLVDLQGCAIGINSAVVFGAQNIGFAIPINKAKKDLDDVRKFGRIKKPFLGVRYVLLNAAFQNKFSLPTDKGAMVLRENIPICPGCEPIVPDSPAAKAGLQEGDIITAFNDTEISEKHGLEEMLDQCKIGEEIKLKILRKGKGLSVPLKLEERK